VGDRGSGTVVLCGWSSGLSGVWIEFVGNRRKLSRLIRDWACGQRPTSVANSVR
jgi:hypothetical protein